MTTIGVDFGTSWPTDKTTVRLQGIKIAGLDFPIVVDMRLPDDRLYLVTYDERGEIREKVEVRIKEAVDGLRRPQAQRPADE